MQWDYGLAKADEKTKGVLNKEREYLQEQVIESEKTAEKEEEGGRARAGTYTCAGGFSGKLGLSSKNASSALIGKVKSVTHRQ